MARRPVVDVMPIRLVAVPVRLILASAANIDDLRRELAVSRLGGRHAEVRALFSRADELLNGYDDASALGRDAARDAWASGRRLIDLNLPVPMGTDADLRTALALLELVAEHCRDGELLSLAPSDEVLSFRRWVADEIEAQLTGGRPTPCPFPVSTEPLGTAFVPDPARTADSRAERSARRLLELQTVTAALAGADDTAGVHEIVLRRVADVVGAATTSVSVLAGDGETLELAGTSGFDQAVSTHWASYPLSADLPASESVRTGVPVYLRTPAELVAGYPALDGRPTVGSEALAVLPLTVADGRVLGALALGYAQPREWLPEDRAVLGLLADAVAQALDRARLHDAERIAADRFRFLAEASEVLSRSLDVNLAMSALAEVAVPRLGDWCSIHLLNDGRPEPVALAAVDADKLELARTLLTKWPVAVGEGTIGRCLADGQPGVWQLVPDEVLPSVARNAEHLAVLRALGIGSGVVVPLVTGGAVVGALAVANLSGRFIGDADVDLAQDLALRAGAAISNARLFGDQQAIAQALQRSLLPHALPRVDGIELGVAYAAAGVGEEVGGDFYDLLALDDRLLISIGDVRGRGVEAAALTGLARHTIRALGRLGLAPDEILRRLDEALRDVGHVDDPESAFCTAIAGWLTRHADEVRFSFASGGHPAPFLLRSGAREVQRPSVRGDLLGVLPEIELVVTDVPLGAGDLLILVTDGVLERRRGADFFDDAGVAATVLANAGMSAVDLAASIARSAQAFAPGATSDDMAVVVLRISDS